ncbi:MAG: HlyD family efflux transporter periplasmic adaptor subunit [Acidobacteria bacterium]|nr:HlyD family efflux transporter periplasmic adaptor subunit [Acidobacteriota bacterium]
MVDIKRKPQGKIKQYVMYAIGGVALMGMTWFFMTLEAAPPTVEAAIIWTGKVEQGELLRQVRGPGTLQPEDVLFVSARTSGVVDEIILEAGANVTPESVIMVLSNPDLELSVQQAEWQLSGAEASYTQLQVTLEQGRLAQQSTLAQVQALYQQARLQADRDAELYEEQLVSQIQMEIARSNADSLRERFDIEKTRLENLEASNAAQLAVQQAQVDQRRAEYQLRLQEIDSLRVRPTITGVLQAVPVEAGQQATIGTTLARVADPTKLMAELRIAQTQAGEVRIGQPAMVDTRNGIVPARVTRIDPAVVQGTVLVDVELLTDDLPPNARPDLSVDGRVEIERLSDVLYVDRPAYGQANQSVGLFQVIGDGTEAVRTTVRFGASSVDKIVVETGLQVGDEIILSDMSRFDTANKVRIN